MAVGNLLIVDSDRATVRQLVSMLSPLPLDLSVAFNKADALETLLRGCVDLCIVGHGLADGNGLELFRDRFAVDLFRTQSCCLGMRI